MKKEEKIRLYYGIFLGIFTVAVGILFIVQAALIYYGGDSPDGKNYTREIAGEKLKQILIPLCFYIAAVIAGFVLSVVFPVTAKLKAERSAGETAAFLRRRLPIGEPTEEFLRAKMWETARWGVRAAALCVCLAAGIASAVYLFDPVHFTGEDLNPEILRMLQNVLPWVGAAFLFVCGACLFDGIAAKRELVDVKTLTAKKLGAPKNGFVFDKLTDNCQSGAQTVLRHEKWILLGVRIALLIAGLTLLLVGIFDGGANDVLIKAINICTECIGLG